MKFKLKSFLALLMLVCLVLTAAGCKGKTEEEPAKEKVNEDFFTESLISDESQSEQAGTNGDASDSGSSNASSDVDQMVHEDNRINGKSWNDVLASMPKNLRGTNLTVYNWNAANEYTGAPEVITQFTKQTGIKVEWRVVAYSDYFKKLAALIASGENIPDVARTLGPVPSHMLNYQPLSTTGYDFTDAAWDKTIMDLYSVNGKVYATSLQNTHIGAADMMFYNKALIDKYDFEDPYKLWKAGKWNWEKYIEMCEDFSDITGTAASGGERWTRPYLTVKGLSGPISFDGKKFYNNTKSKQFLDAYQQLGDYFNKNGLFVRGNSDAFDNGTLLFCTGGAVHLRKKNSYFGLLKNANTLYAVPMPAEKGQKTYYQGIGEGEAYAVVKGAPNAKAVPYFLRYFLDGANYDLNTYFCNKQNLEVYNWCMNQKNRVFFYTYYDYTSGNQNNGLDYQTTAQVKKYIDANSGTVDREVKSYNDTLAKLK